MKTHVYILYPQTTERSREEFMKAQPGRIITWNGTLYCSQEAVELEAMYLTKQGAQSLWNVSCARTRKKRGSSQCPPGPRAAWQPRARPGR